MGNVLQFQRHTKEGLDIQGYISTELVPPLQSTQTILCPTALQATRYLSSIVGEDNFEMLYVIEYIKALEQEVAGGKP